MYLLVWYAIIATAFKFFFFQLSINQINFASMRLITYILAFIILGLSCFPCADAAATVANKIQSELVVNHNDASSDENHDDICPPFCHCSCCPGFSIIHIPASLNCIEFNPAKKFKSYLPDNLLQISLPIWQPPRLV